MRSARLGGNIYAKSAELPNAADAVERENLVRVMASILHSLPSPREAVKSPAKQMMRAPSSHLHRRTTSASTRTGLLPAQEGVGDTDEAHSTRMQSVLEEARSQGLAGALVCFLPPAREDGPDGVTRHSVALHPEWKAPPGVTANVCSCLLHLMGGASSDIIDQVRTKP